jgi:TPR repeat protein
VILSPSIYLRTGIEVSESNAAYVLRTKIKVPPRTATSSGVHTGALQASDAAAHTCPDSGGACDATASQTQQAAELVDPAELKERMLARLYRLSAHHGNRESFQHLGTCYFRGACGVGAVDHAKALWYYSKASFLDHPLSSAYVGVMYHFGLGVPVNLLRAERYYTLAIEQGADKSVATIVQSLKYALSMKDYYFMMPVNMGVDYVVRTLWSA